MNDFKKLVVWKRALDLTTEIYVLSSGFPRDERFGLTSQIRRSVISVSSNIAEGAGRGTRGQFTYFLGVAAGSCYELESQVHVAKQLRYVDGKEAKKVLREIEEIQKMLYSLIRAKSRGKG